LQLTVGRAQAPKRRPASTNIVRTLNKTEGVDITEKVAARFRVY